MGRGGRRAVALTLGLAAGLLAAELGARALFALAGTPYSATRTAAWGDELVRSARLDFGPDAATDDGERRRDADLRLHPYVGYARLDVDDAVDRLLAVPPDTRVAIVVGGSVAAGFGNAAFRRLGPSVFGERPAVFVNLAVAGHKQPQQLHLVAQLFALGLRPDFVLDLDGFNEVALGVANGRAGLHPSQPSSGHWLPLASRVTGDPGTLALTAELFALRERLDRSLRRATSWGLFASAVTGQLVVNHLRRARATLLERRRALVERDAERDLPPHLSGPTRDPLTPLARSVALWSHSSRALRALCETYGAAYVHVLQPTLHDPGAKPWSDAERATAGLPAAWIEGVEQGYPLLREQGRRLAAEGELFFDASRIFAAVETTLYVDGCHFGREGHERLADAIAAFLDDAVAAGRLAVD